MSEARSLTPLSEADYETIAAAVMETSRGRWFMTEYARRNRQADTMQLLGAIGRIERAVGVASQQIEPTNEPGLREAAALIIDLRVDLERVSGKGGEPSSGLATRVEAASARIMAATEHVQEASWSLREAGASDELCDLLDRSAVEIHAATTAIEGTGRQIGKIADTMAMLDSNLRAIIEAPQEQAGHGIDSSADPREPFLDLREAAPLSSYEDIEIVEIEDYSAPMPSEARSIQAKAHVERKMGTIKALADDIVFHEVGSEPTPEPVKPAETSEVDLRVLDMLSAPEKLAYFA